MSESATKLSIHQEKKERVGISKRQRFIISVLVLTSSLFFSENLFSQYAGIITVLTLPLLTLLFLFWSNYKDIKESFSFSIFTLPFLFSLSVCLFYFLIPDRKIYHLALLLIYAIGLYSLFLSQNIFIVASIRTIALLSSARLVSTVITTISFFLLSWTVFSLHLFLFPTVLIVFIYSFFLISHGLWIYTLEKSFFVHFLWSALLSLCLCEVSLILWFWPSVPAFISIFLTGFFYSLIGLSHLWFEKRLFKGVLLEYVWWSVIVFCLLLFFTYFQ